MNKRLYKDSVRVEDYSVEQYYVKEDPVFKWNGTIFLVTFLVIYMLLVWGIDLPFKPYFILASIGLYGIGLLSDQWNIPSFLKLIIEIGVSALFVHGGIYIESLGGIAGYTNLTQSQVWLLNLPLITLLINSLKQMNAVVGMSVSFTLINALLFSGFFLLFGPHVYWVISFLLVLCLLIYIINNFYSPSNQFGNSGSLFLAGVLVFLALELYKIERPALAEKGFINILPIIYGMFIVPVYDTIRVMIWRIIRGQSPFRPDQKHFLSLLNVGGYNPTKAMLRIFIIHIAMVLLGVYLASTTMYLGYSLAIITAVQIAFIEYHGLFDDTKREDNEDIMEVLK